jgi:hypothetical protein
VGIGAFEMGVYGYLPAERLSGRKMVTVFSGARLRTPYVSVKLAPQKAFQVKVWVWFPKLRTTYRWITHSLSRLCLATHPHSQPKPGRWQEIFVNKKRSAILRVHTAEICQGLCITFDLIR